MAGSPPLRSRSAEDRPHRRHPRTGVPLRRQITLASYWFGIYFLWGSFIAIVLPALLAPDQGVGLVPSSQKNTYLSVLETIGLIFPIVVQPAAGAFSDRLRTRWGRRRPLIASGAAGGVISLILVGAAPTFWLLLVAYCLLQIAMNISQGGYQGLLPDVVPGGDRGVASGFLGVGILLGQVAGFAAAAALSPRVNVLVTAAVVGLTALATCVFVKEQALAPAGVRGAHEKPALARWASQARGYLAEFRQYPDFCWVVASRFLSYTGLACIQRFAYNYLHDSYHVYRLDLGVVTLTLGGGRTATAIIFAIVVTFGLLATYPAVKLSDRVGRRRVLVVASILGAVGSFAFFAAQSFTAVLFCAIPVGIAFGMLVSVDWAFMADLAPRSRSGKFLGFSNIAAAGSQAFAPSLLGPVIDQVNNSTNSTQGYSVLFVVSAVFFLAGAGVLARVRTEKIPEADEPIAPTTHPSLDLNIH